MKLLGFLLNVVIGPIGLFAFVYFFYVQDIREAILMTLIITTIFTGLRLVFNLLKVLFSAVTFNFIGAMKTSASILVSLGVLAFYWLAYYFYYGADFALSI